MAKLNWQFATTPLTDVDEQLQQGIRNILFQAALVTGLVMGILFLLEYEIDDIRPEPHLAVFIFFMAFTFSGLVWIAAYFLNTNRLTNWLRKKGILGLFVQVLCNLAVTSVLMYVWAMIDKAVGMESLHREKIVAVIQVRGFFIITFSALIMWGIGQALAQQRARDMINQLKDENFEARFEILKQQVNPHFLFNSLNILKGMIRTQNPNAEEYVMRLAEVYRYILQSNTQTVVTVAEEIKILEAYIFMLNNRFKDAIAFKIELPPNIQKSFVPPLTFQILVENCVKHNILTKNKPLLVEIFERKNYLVIRNNLQPKTAFDTSNQVGLQNIKQRYSHLNTNPLRVEKTPQYFTVFLPLIES